MAQNPRMIGADDTASTPPPAKRPCTEPCHPYLLLQATTPDGKTTALVRARQHGPGYAPWRTPALEQAVATLSLDVASLSVVRRLEDMRDADVHLVEDADGRYHLRVDRPVEMIEWPYSAVVLGGVANGEERTVVCTSFAHAYAQLRRIDDQFADSTLEAYIIPTNELLTWNSEDNFGEPVEYL